MSITLSREWILKAEEDYQAALLLSRRRKKPLLNSVCFHSQQAAEKYLKSYLSLKGTRFSKTHDLILLKNLCVKCDGDFEFLSDLVVTLNPYAVEFRYPGEQANRRDAQRALFAAKEIRDWVRRKMKK